MEDITRIKADIIPYTAEYAKTVLSWIESEETYRNVCRGHGFPPPENLLETWQRKEVSAYLLSTDNKLLAYGELWNRPLEMAMEIAHILVQPQHRDKGLGTKMVDLLYRRAAERPNIAKVVAHVFNEDEAAVGCCLNAGFELQGTTTYTQGLRLVRMVLD